MKKSHLFLTSGSLKEVLYYLLHQSNLELCGATGAIVFLIISRILLVKTLVSE